MADFKLDTSGTVEGVKAPSITWTTKLADLDFCDLPALTQGYVAALLSGSREALQIASRLQFQCELFAGFSDLAPETLARIISECDLRVRNLPPGMAATQDTPEEGARFWTVRQEGRAEVFGFPPLTVLLGDDGKVRFA